MSGLVMNTWLSISPSFRSPRLFFSCCLFPSLSVIYQVIKRFCFLDLWHRWKYFGSTDPLLKCLQLLCFGLSAAGTFGLYIFWDLKNNKTAKRIAAKSGKTVTVTDESNHLSSSSNSPSLSLTGALYCSLSLPLLFSLSQCVHPSYPLISQPSVSLSTLQGSICSICVFWLCVSKCMYVRFVIVKQCVHVGCIVCGPCVLVLTWLLSNLDVLGRGPAPLPLSAKFKRTTENRENCWEPIYCIF